MKREEFLKAVVYLEVGTGKALSADAKDVYFDCLGDLAFEVLALAAKRVLMKHVWASFPSIAELRAAAAETQQGEVKALSAGEAWAIAWRIASNTDPEVDGSFSRASKGAPSIVLDAIRCYGLMDLCFGKEPVGVVRGQFMKIYEQLAARAERMALFPKALIEQIENRPVAEVAKTLIESIGQLPE